MPWWYKTFMFPPNEVAGEPHGAASPLRSTELYCPDCGYSLRGLTSDRCPECGLLLDFIDSASSTIAWVDRRRRGRVRGYVLTVFAVISRPKILCREVFRPVSLADAQRFRWVTVALMTLSLWSWAAQEILRSRAVTTTPPSPFTMFADPQPPYRSLLAYGVGTFGVVGVCFAGFAAAAGLFLFPFLITGLPSYLFHPKSFSIELQNRAIAMSYYATAPLALAPLALVLLRLLRLSDFWRSGTDEAFLDGLLAAFIAFLYWRTLVVFAQRVLPRNHASLRVALLTPLLWLVAASLTLIGLPALILYAWLLIDTHF